MVTPIKQKAYQIDQAKTQQTTTQTDTQTKTAGQNKDDQELGNLLAGNKKEVTATDAEVKETEAKEAEEGGKGKSGGLPPGIKMLMDSGKKTELPPGLAKKFGDQAGDAEANKAGATDPAAAAPTTTAPTAPATQAPTAQPALSIQEGIAKFQQTGQPVWNTAECPCCKGIGCKYCSTAVPPAVTAPPPVATAPTAPVAQNTLQPTQGLQLLA